MDKKPLLKIEKIITKIIPAFIYAVSICLISPLWANAQEIKTHTAKNGDGIYSILREYNIPLSYIDEFKHINEDVLNGDTKLHIGQTYKIPLIDKQGNNTESTKKPSDVIATKRFPIFGVENQDIDIVSSELSNAVYYLVSGHGGPDPGAVGKYNGKELCEDEYAYDITLRLARELLSMGATVYMITRDNSDGIRGGWYLSSDKDEVCYPTLHIPLNQNARLRQRKDAVNKLYRKYKGHYQRAIIIHVDSRSTHEKIDVFFYHDQRSKAGKKTALTLRNTFDKKYNEHQPGRGYRGSVSSRNLYMLKNTIPVATYIELGNINHQRDLQRFIIEDNRQAVANWLAEGLKKDYESNR